MVTILRLAIEKALASKRSTFVATLDFRKAFDSVPHSRLFLKLRKTPLPPQFALALCVIVERHVSRLPDGTPIRILRGVPQGSLLAPFLFLVFIDDLPKFVEEEVRKKLKLKDSDEYSPLPLPLALFADDTNCIAYTLRATQAILKSAEEWSHLNRLDFQPQKSKVACFAKAPPKTKLFFMGRTLEWSDEVIIVGVPFVVADVLKGVGTLRAPEKAKKLLRRIRTVMRSVDPDLARDLFTTYVRPTMLYGSEAFAIHPKTRLVQNEAVNSALQTFRCAKLARAHLALDLTSLDAHAASLRLVSALKFRCSRLAAMRELIDTAIAQGWPWGRLISDALAKYDLVNAWENARTALDAVESEKEKRIIINGFRILTQARVRNAERARFRIELFKDEDERTCVFESRGVHPLCCGPLGATGYLLLRDEFLPPHLLHSEDAPPPPPCPICLAHTDRPSHLLTCPDLAPSPAAGLSLEHAHCRWNLRDPVLGQNLLRSLKSRLAVRHQSRNPGNAMEDEPLTINV
jgi:hypothetical protein